MAVPSNNEVLGTLIIDGIFADCAVTASRVGGIPEMIKHGETGLLFEKQDSEAMANCLEQLMVSPEERKKLAANAKKLALHSFTSEQMIKGNFKIYQTLMDSKA